MATVSVRLQMQTTGAKERRNGKACKSGQAKIAVCVGCGKERSSNFIFTSSQEHIPDHVRYGKVSYPSDFALAI